MTFTEAAVEVLRLVGKPLHYKKITELAIERNLLSHVGKTPEVTMSSRLATMVKRDRGEVPIIKVKPGVFGLREFTEEQLADLSGDIMELPEVEVENEENGAEPHAEAAEGAQAAERPAPEPRRPLPGADVFPEEEDDDEPILGSPDEDEEDDDEDEEGAERGDAAQTSDSRSARRRRKRRRKGRGEANGESADEGSELSLRDDRRYERRHDRHERRNERHDRRDRRDERRDREEVFVDREPADGDLLGKDLADAVASVLGQAGPRGYAAYRVADLLVQRGRLAGDPQSLVPTVMAAVRADIARKKIERVRPRFRIEGTSLVLSDFLLPQDVVRAEQEVVRAAERQRERARRAYLRSLSELSNAGLAELIATWLNAEGVVGLRAVRRPGSGPGELHLAGTLRRGVEEMRLAIMVYRDVRELGRERVIEARGVLHYYGNASAAWLITLGNVLGGAREEAQAPASAPVALYDGMALAAAMERVGVGLSVQYVPVSAVDTELLESLRAPRVDHDRHRDRERARRHEPAPRPVDEELDEEEDLLEDEELERGAGELELAEGEAENLTEGAPEGAESPAETVEAREGGRRRRRRRRRRGGRDREAAAALPEGGGEARDWEEGDERAELDRADDEEGPEELAEEGVEARGFRDDLDEDSEPYRESLSAAEEVAEGEEADAEAEDADVEAEDAEAEDAEAEDVEASARPVWDEEAEEDAAVADESEAEEPQAEGQAEEAASDADEGPADELELYDRDR